MVLRSCASITAGTNEPSQLEAPQACLPVMESLPGETEAAERLKNTSLRDFAVMPDRDEDDPNWALPSYKFTLYDVPVPTLYKYALTLIGCPAYGPGEKMLWCIPFLYEGEWCELALQKFGLRIYLRTRRSEADARATQRKIAKQLRSSMRTVERVVQDAAPGLLAQRSATVKNQHASLLRAYNYFRARAENPVHIEDERTEFEPEPGGSSYKGWSFKSGRAEMDLNSFHDMIAAVNAYLSLLEHDLVLALAFCDFDPEQDNLTDVIGSRWGEKWDRILGKQGQAERYRQQLFDVVERWRNPYSHGGFEKGHGATIWLHTPGVNAALPVALTKVQDSPLYSFSAGGQSIIPQMVELFGEGELPSSLEGSDSTIAEVFALFDEIDGWMGDTLPEATSWMRSGLDVRYDADFRSDLVESRTQEGGFERLLKASEYAQAQFENMEF